MRAPSVRTSIDDGIAAEPAHGPAADEQRRACAEPPAPAATGADALTRADLAASAATPMPSERRPPCGASPDADHPMPAHAEPRAPAATAADARATGDLATFAARLLDPDLPPPPGLRVWNGSDPGRRFAVYRNNVVAGLIDGLAAAFPVTAALVGGDFFRGMAQAFVLRVPPRSPVLLDYGQALPAFIAGFGPAAGVPYLADVARLEALRVSACNAADAEPLAADAFQALLADPARLAAARVLLHPACRWLRSPYAVHAIWEAHQGVDTAAVAEHGSGRADVAAASHTPVDARSIAPQPTDARPLGSRPVDSLAAKRRTLDPRAASLRTADAQTVDSWTIGSSTTDASTIDSSTTDARTIDPGALDASIAALHGAASDAVDRRPVDLSRIDVRRPQDVLVARPALALQTLALPAGGAALLEALAEGQPLAGALAQASRADDADPVGLLTLLIHHGLAVAFHDDLAAREPEPDRVYDPRR